MPYQGGVMGFTTCMTAFIAREILRSQASPDLARGIHAGLIAMRDLYDKGYDDEGHNGTIRLSFPTTRVITAVQQKELELSKEQKPSKEWFSVPVLYPLLPSWTILHSQIQRKDHREELLELAKELARKGPDIALPNVPRGCFGALISIDPHEIAGFNYIRRQITSYCDGSQKRPLSIALFGQPGSGKSFAIRQLVKSLPDPKLRDQIGEPLHYNVSQFKSSDDLVEVMQYVRDKNIQKNIPLVCWDEFDTARDGKELGWLHYFLAPMQDGRFWDGHNERSIGNAIFVFVGSISQTMEAFRKRAEEFPVTKARDFISRLQGYINILGLNPQPEEDPQEGYHILRRAILLRSLLKEHAPQLFSKKGQVEEFLHIDEGVLRAFLQVPGYQFSTRSMETIITMSGLSGQKSFEQSSLPPRDLLQHVVDAVVFMQLVQSQVVFCR